MEKHNIIADALRRLDITLPSKSKLKPTTEYLVVKYTLDANNLPVNEFPVMYSTIMKHQHKDQTLLKPFKSSNDLEFKEFHVDRKTF